MKKAVLLLLLFASCQNKQANLVDLDKRYRDSARTYFNYAQLCLDSTFNSHRHKTELERFQTHDTSDDISKETMDRYKHLIAKSAEFRVIADSIEWELKK